MNTLLLKEICDVTMGQAPPGTSYNDEMVGHPLIAGAGDFGDRTPAASRFTTAASRISKVDDIILCIRATIGDRNWSDSEYCLGRGVAGLRPHTGELDRNYLWHWLSVAKRPLMRQARGSTFKQVNRAAIETLEIPVPVKPDGTPDLAEQKRIAAILDKADAIRRKRQEAIALTEEFLRSAFLDMFGDPVTNPNSITTPKGWSVVSITDIQADVERACVGGPFGSNLTSKDYVKGGVPVIRGSNLSVDRCFLSEDAFAFVSPAKAESLSQNMAFRGDVIFTQRGTLGQVGMIPQNSKFEQYVLSQSQMKLTPNTSLVDPIWLVSYFQAPIAQKLIEKRTLATGVPHINLGILREFPVRLPPIEEQRRFGRLRRELQERATRQTSVLAETDNLFNALVQRAFRGEL